MALTGIYNSNDREIVLTVPQAQLFNQTIQYFKTNGVGGDSVFEDTYVLQKQVAEYIKENVGESSPVNSAVVLQIYNDVLGISPATPPPPSGGGDVSLPSDDTDAYTPNDDVFTVGGGTSSGGDSYTSTGGGTSSGGNTNTSTEGGTSGGRNRFRRNRN